MHVHLRQFLDRHTVRCASATYPLKVFLTDFLNQLSAKSRGSWRRSRVVADLVQAGYVVALDPRSRTYAIAGLAPKAQFHEVGGRLELTTNA